MYRSTLYLASRNESTTSVTVGEEIRTSLRLRDRADQGAYNLRLPGGVEERILPRVNAISGLAGFSFPHTTETGIYEIRRDGATQTGKEKTSVLQAIAVNVSIAESDTRSATEEELNMFWQKVGLASGQITHLSNGETMETAILESRFGVELWKYFVALALFCALMEMAIGREKKD